MEEELKCKVCGKLASEDCHFRKEFQLCNRHYLQLRNNGKFLDDKQKHNPKRRNWTEEERVILENGYRDGLSLQKIADTLNRSRGSIATYAQKHGISEKYIRNNSPNFKADYQDYNWCYERYVNKHMTHQEMADEAGCTLRTIQKWCADIHKLNNRTMKYHLHLSDKQRELIIVGTLGDGHIDKREEQPMYIESHAEDEKDYLFYKYNVLKDLCNKEPSYIPSSHKDFHGKKYLCQPQYRFETRIVAELKGIRDMKRIDKIKNLSAYQLSLLILDDASRDRYWSLCVAEWSEEEIDLLIKICKEKFNIELHKLKDERYLNFTSESSRIMDNIILNNIPNELDIVRKKIFKNKEINCA